MSPGVELVKKEFEEVLPAKTEIKIHIQTTSLDLIKTALV
jgi:hypothetical protein